MGGQRSAPAAAVKGFRRLFVGSSVKQRGQQDGSPFVTTTTGFRRGVQELSCQRHCNCSLCRDNGRQLETQVGLSQVGFYRTFSASAVPLAKHAMQETGGKKRRGGKTAAEIASHNAATQLRPIVYQCTACTAICVSRILKDPYDRGVTILRCMDCRSVNLISDQLGLFKEPGSMKRFLRDRGVDVDNGPEGRYELTPESLAPPQPQEASTA